MLNPQIHFQPVKFNMFKVVIDVSSFVGIPAGLLFKGNVREKWKGV